MRLLHGNHVLVQSLPPSIHKQLIEANLISPEDRIETRTANRFLIHTSHRPLLVEINGQETKLICQMKGCRYQLLASPARFENDRLWLSLDAERPPHYFLEKEKGPHLFILEDGSVSDSPDGSWKLVKDRDLPFRIFCGR